MKLCKLTTQDLTTHNGFQWELGVWREAKGTGTTPCSSDVLHFYHHPLLAVLFNMIHACINNPRLFEIEIDRELGTDGLKGWCKRQRLVKEIKLPEVTNEQRIEFAIKVTMLVCKEPKWLTWANGWLDGSDRSIKSAKDIAIIMGTYYTYSTTYNTRAAYNAAMAADIGCTYSVDAIHDASCTPDYSNARRLFLSNIIKIAENLK